MSRPQGAFIPLCVALSVSACVSASTVPPELARTIPSNARAIRLFSDQPTAEYYRTVYRSLVAQGFGIAQENPQMGTLSTQTKDTGQNTLLKLTVYVQDTTDGAVATLRGQWEVTAESCSRAARPRPAGEPQVGRSGPLARWRSSPMRFRTRASNTSRAEEPAA